MNFFVFQLPYQVLKKINYDIPSLQPHVALYKQKMLDQFVVCPDKINEPYVGKIKIKNIDNLLVS